MSAGQRWASLVAAIAITFAILGIIADFTAVSDFVRRQLAETILNLPTSSHLDKSALIVAWLAPTVVLLALLFLLLVVTTLRLALPKAINDENTARWQHEFQEMISSVRKYVNNAFPDRPHYDVIKLHVDASVSNDGTVDWKKDVTIKASEHGCPFLIIEEASDDSAKAAETPAAINVNVRAITPGFDLTVLPTINEARLKEFAIFPIPPLKPNEEFSFEVRHNWPGFSADIVNDKSMRMYWNVKRRKLGDTCDVSIKYRVF